MLEEILLPDVKKMWSLIISYNQNNKIAEKQTFDQKVQGVRFNDMNVTSGDKLKSIRTTKQNNKVLEMCTKYVMGSFRQIPHFKHLVPRLMTYHKKICSIVLA